MEAEQKLLTGWRSQVARFLGIPVPNPRRELAEDPDRAQQRLEDVREEFGGQIAPLPTTVTRWHLADLESAIHEADTGNLQRAASLCRSMRRDGVLSGVLSTRTSGLVRLPKKFTGRDDMVATLQGDGKRRGIFRTLCPTSELALLAGDGILLGVGVAEKVAVEGLPYKVLRRLDPEWLRYRWYENRWYYNSIAGQIPIIPGDRNWVLHTPGGDHTPWMHGLWSACGRSFISKDHAFMYRENYGSKLAHPARVAVAPQGATEEQHLSWFQKVMAWGVNTVFGLKPGYDVKLLESNGRGFEVFQQMIATANEEMIIAVAGQIMTTTGGTGFANANVHQSIRADLIQDTAEGLAHTLNTQVFPSWVNDEWGGDSLDEAPEVEWDTAPPKDLKATAESYAGAAGAIWALNDALKSDASNAASGSVVDALAILRRFGIPIIGDTSQQRTAARVAAIRTAVSIRARLQDSHGRISNDVERAIVAVLEAA